MNSSVYCDRMQPVQQVQLEISLLLNIPNSTVSGIITKWKHLGTRATLPQSGRPRKMTESFMEWVSMAELLHPRHTSASAMQSVGSSSGNLMDESEFGS